MKPAEGVPLEIRDVRPVLPPARPMVSPDDWPEDRRFYYDPEQPEAGSPWVDFALFGAVCVCGAVIGVCGALLCL